MIYPDQVGLRVQRKQTQHFKNFVQSNFSNQLNFKSSVVYDGMSQKISNEVKKCEQNYPNKICSCGCQTTKKGNEHCNCSNCNKETSYYPDKRFLIQSDINPCNERPDLKLSSDTTIDKAPPNYPFPLGAFRSHGELVTSSLYGKALATTGSCSFWNVGGPFLLSAAHCDGHIKERTLAYGLYGDTWEKKSSNRFQLGQQDAIRRWASLGLPYKKDQNGDLMLDAVLLTPETFDGDTAFFDKTFSNNFNQSIQAFSAEIINTSWTGSSFFRDPKRTENFRGTFVDRRSVQESLTNDQDISYWRAKPKTWHYTDPLGKPRTISLFPSNFYGRIPFFTYEKNGDNYTFYNKSYSIEYDEQPKNFSISDKDLTPAILGVNKYCGIENSATYSYLSPLGTIQGIGPNRFRYSNGNIVGNEKIDIFTSGLYAYSGTSGSSLFLPSINRSIGVVSQGGSRPYGHFAPNNFTSQSSLIPREARIYSPTSFREDLPIDPVFVTSPRVSLASARGSLSSNKIGGKGGKNSIFECPIGYAAAGIINSSVTPDSSEKERIGNFGIVCMPYSTPSFYRWNLSVATVNAGGSIDISEYYPPSLRSKKPRYDFRDARNVPLDIYMNEYLTTNTTNSRVIKSEIISDFRPFYYEIWKKAQEQQLTMCSPGFYLSGLIVLSGGFERSLQLIESVLALKCQKFQSGDSYWRLPYNSIIGGPGISSNVHVERIECPGNAVVVGADIASGWFTDSIGFRCKSR